MSNGPASGYAKQYAWAHYNAALCTTAAAWRRDIHEGIFTRVEHKEAFFAAAPDNITFELYQLIVDESSRRNPPFLAIIKTIALAGSPLALAQIAGRLHIKTEEVADALVVPGLQHVIDLPSTNSHLPVTLCHQSFRNFLIKKPKFTSTGGTTKDRLILVVGASGAGKSYFINRLLSAIGRVKTVLEGHTLAPGTFRTEPTIVLGRDWVGKYPHINGEGKLARFIIIDTPGFNVDLEFSNIPAVENLPDWIKKTYPEALSNADNNLFEIAGVLYLHDIRQDRGVTSSSLRALDSLLSRWWIPPSLVVIVTTRWGGVGEFYHAREKAMVETFWTHLLGREGAKVMRFRSGSVETEEMSALEIVDPILRKSDKFAGEAALKALHQAQNSLESLDIGDQETRRDLKRAFDKSMQLHKRALALVGGRGAQEDGTILTRELEESKQEIYELVSYLSASDQSRLSPYCL